MGEPDWAMDKALGDPSARSARGDEINRHIREWASHQRVDDLVARAQELGVPMARYNTPEQVLSGRHETARGLFADVPIPGDGTCRIQTGPFRFGEKPLPVLEWPSEPGADQELLKHGWSMPVSEHQREDA
jgi:crotonobetainyl-CoA:carnitine CoA-transferase CaiB-like acyl-CoA transferase